MEKLVQLLNTQQFKSLNEVEFIIWPRISDHLDVFFKQRLEKFHSGGKLRIASRCALNISSVFLRTEAFISSLV